MKIIERKVKRGVAKDYLRNAKYFDYYYINYKKERYNLKLNGWNSGLNVINNTVQISGQKIKLIWGKN